MQTRGFAPLRQLVLDALAGARPIYCLQKLGAPNRNQTCLRLASNPTRNINPAQNLVQTKGVEPLRQLVLGTIDARLSTVCKNLAVPGGNDPPPHA